jgi:hypothetical protein
MSQTEKPANHLIRGFSYLRKNRRQTAALLICLATSTFLWLMIQLNKQYLHHTTVQASIAISGGNIRLIPLQNDTLLLEVHAQGYQLLFNELALNRNLIIRVGRDLLIQGSQPGTGFITSKSLLSAIAAQFPASARITAIRPDTLFFRTEEMVSRKIKVEPDIRLGFLNGFLLFDTLTLEPDSVIVRGDKEFLRTLTEISTRRLELADLDKPFSYRLNLINPDPDRMTLSQQEATVKGDVVPFTSSIFTVPLLLPDSLIPRLINPAPEVEIHCLIPQEYRRIFRKEQIRVSVSVATEHDKLLKVVPVVEAPRYVKEIRVIPEMVTLELKAE